MYKEIHNFEKRKIESEKIRLKYSDRVPIIVEKYKKSKVATIDKNKFLAPQDMTIGQFIYIIRKRIQLDSNEALFITINSCAVTSSKLLSEIYENNKDSDGFLYIVYSSENTFG